MMRRWLQATCAAFLALILIGAASPAQTEELALDDRRILVLLQLAPGHYRPGASYGGGYGDLASRSAQRHVAERIARDHSLTLVTDWPMPLLHLNCFIMAVKPGQSPEVAAAEVSRDPGVRWSQPMHTYLTHGDPVDGRDPLLAAQPAAMAWHLADLHRLVTGRGASVAVIDSGIDRHHPDLAGQVDVFEDFVPDHPATPEQHGTAVAGIIAAREGNGVGIVGVAPHARLFGLRACWQQAGSSVTVCDSLSLAEALHAAIEHRATIINLSLSGPDDRLLRTLIELGQARGATVVAAFDRKLPGGGFPATSAQVVAVADTMSPVLPAGVYVAPGRDVVTTQPGGRWFPVNGSSYSAAHVSGLLALLQERQAQTGRRSKGLIAYYVGGVIDACAVIVQLGSHCECACAIDLAVVAAKR